MRYNLSIVKKVEVKGYSRSHQLSSVEVSSNDVIIYSLLSVESTLAYNLVLLLVINFLKQFFFST